MLTSPKVAAQAIKRAGTRTALAWLCWLAAALAAPVHGQDSTLPFPKALVAVAGLESAVLSFIPSADANSTLQAFLAPPSTPGTTASTGLRKPTPANDPVTHIFTGLAGSTSYTLQVLMVNDSGMGTLTSTTVTTSGSIDEAAILSAGADAGAKTATLRYVANEDVMAFLWADTDPSLDSDAVAERATAAGFTATATALTVAERQFAGLRESTVYTFYAVGEDAAGNRSLASASAMTRDATIPALSAVAAEVGVTTATLRFHASDPGQAWLLADARSGLPAAEVVATAEALIQVVPTELYRYEFAGLDESTTYTLYVTLEAGTGNRTAAAVTVMTRDATPPEALALMAAAGASTATLTYWSGEAGTAFLWADTRAGLGAGAVVELAAAARTSTGAAAGVTARHEFAGLAESTTYTLYVAVEDAAGNRSLASATVTTLDATAPSAGPLVATAGARTAVLSFAPSEAGHAWLLASTETGLARDRVLSQAQAVTQFSAGEVVRHEFTGLAESTAYTLYAALRDEAGNGSLDSRVVVTGDGSNPAVDAAAASRASSGLTLRYVSSEAGTAFLWADTDPSLTLAEVAALALAAGSTAAAAALALAEHQFTGLAEATAYTLYVAVEDTAGNRALASAAAMTLDATAPALSALGAVVGASSATLRFHASEPGQAWLLADARAGLTVAAVIAAAGALLPVAPGELARHEFAGLAESTAYTLYVAVEDAAGNRALATVTVTTRDATAPEALALAAEPGASSATLTYWSSEAGTAFLWADTRAGLGAGAVVELAAAARTSTGAAAGVTARHEFAGLEEVTTYTLYVVVEDAAGNRALASLAVATLDATAPSAGPLVAAAGARTAVLSFAADEDARAWLLADTRSGLDFQGVILAPGAEALDARAGEPVARTFTGLAESTAYTLYVALEDAAGNRGLSSVAVTTGDATNPTLTLSAAAAAGASSATLFYVSNEDGTAFLWADTDPSLTLADAAARAAVAGATALATALAPAEHQFTDLTEATAYTLYVAVEDAAGNRALATAMAMTLDATAPALSALSTVVGASAATLRFHANEPGRAWLHVSTQAGLDDAAVVAAAGALLQVTPGELARHEFAGLAESTTYTLYVVVEDAAGNRAAASAMVTTRDATAPETLALAAAAGASSAALTYWSSEAGTAFLWVDTRAGLGARAVAALAAAAGAGASSPAAARVSARHEFTGLAEATTYTLYVVVEDAAGNRALASLAVATLDATAASAGPLVAAAGARTAVLSFAADEDARAWLLADTRSGLDFQGVILAPGAEALDARAGEPVAWTFTGLAESTTYTLYVALEDAAGNRSLATATVTTGDATNPTLTLSAAAAAGASTAALTYVSNEDGVAFLWADTDPSLTLAEAAARAAVAGSTATATALAPAEHQFTDLTEATAYTLYVAVEDAAGNRALATAMAMTLDATAPALSALSVVVGASAATLRFHANEPGLAWLHVSTQAGLAAAAVVAAAGALIPVAPGELARHEFAGLAESTTYTLYVVVEDAAGNRAAASAMVTTRDATAPETLALAAAAGASSAALTYWSAEAGTAFLWADTRAGLDARAVAALAAAAGASSPAAARVSARHEFTGLAEATTYTLYVVVEDAAGNRVLASLAVATLDATAASAGPLVAAAGARTAVLSFAADEDARAWLLADTRSGLDFQGVILAPGAEALDARAGEPVAWTFTGLAESTTYTLYVALEDAAGNRSLATATVTTGDATNPTLTLSAAAAAGASTAELTYVSNEAGVAFLWADTDPSLTLADAAARATAADSTAAVTALVPAEHQFTDLTEATAYTLYVAVEDAAGNRALATAMAMTLDATAPALSALSAVVGASTATLRFHSSEPGLAWLLADARAGLTAAAVVAVAGALLPVAPGELARHEFAGLAESTTYTLYVVVEDAAGNRTLASVTVTTRDATPPLALALATAAGASTATLSYWSGEDGTAFLWADTDPSLALADAAARAIGGRLHRGGHRAGGGRAPVHRSYRGDRVHAVRGGRGRRRQPGAGERWRDDARRHRPGALRARSQSPGRAPRRCASTPASLGGHGCM